jgi:hypothetical protein
MINNRFNVVYHLLGLVKLLFYKLKRIKMTGYKLYIHEGKGHYIGSCVIVIAGSLMMAEKIIRQSLDDMGLSNEELNIIEKELISESVIYKLSGDY